MVLKNTQGAEALVKTYETKLCEEDVITVDKGAIDRLIATLKVSSISCTFTEKQYTQKLLVQYNTYKPSFSVKRSQSTITT